MSTDQALLEDPRPAPPQEALERYKQAVFQVGRGEDPPGDLDSILFDTGRLSVDFERDVRTFTRRLQAAEQLKTEVPSLQAKAAELAAEAEKIEPESPEDVQRKPVADMRVGQLWAILKRLDNPGSDDWTHPAHRAAREARRNAETTQAEAKRVLLQTCDPGILEKINALRGKGQGIQRQIDERREVVDAPATVNRLRQEAEALSREPDRPVEDPMGLQTVDGQRMIFSAREQLGRIRQQLTYFRSLLPQRDAALEANRKDQARIAQLGEERTRLEGMRFEPTCMAFSTQ